MTCTLTNSRSTAELTLIKSVTNDNGGTATAADFTLTYTGAASGSEMPRSRARSH